jgi:hypothetical protein
MSPLVCSRIKVFAFSCRRRSCVPSFCASALDEAELRRAFGAATAGLLAEIQHADPGLAERLRAPLLALTDPALSA